MTSTILPIPRRFQGSFQPWRAVRERVVHEPVNKVTNILALDLGEFGTFLEDPEQPTGSVCRGIVSKSAIKEWVFKKLGEVVGLGFWELG